MHFCVLATVLVAKNIKMSKTRSEEDSGRDRFKETRVWYTKCYDKS